MTSPETRPLSPEAKSIAKEIDARLRGDAPKFGERTTVNEKQDVRLTKILAWVSGIGAVFVTSLAIWAAGALVNVDKQVGILLDRPAPVSKTQYDQDRQEMIITMKQLQTDVNEIKIKQAEARQYGQR